jgi:molybdopterin synthase sulfur carrier subunit
MSTVVLPGVLRQYSGGARSVQISGACSLAEALDQLDEHCPRLIGRIRDEQGALRRYVNVYVDGVEARAADGLATVVGPASEILVLPSVAGG